MTALFCSFFSRSIETSEEMKDFNRVCIYVDNQFQAENSFTVRNTEVHMFFHQMGSSSMLVLIGSWRFQIYSVVLLANTLGRARVCRPQWSISNGDSSYYSIQYNVHFGLENSPHLTAFLALSKNAIMSFLLHKYITRCNLGFVNTEVVFSLLK